MHCISCDNELENGIISNGFTYCDEDCEKKDWKEKRADEYARNESCGLYTNYEDYAENELYATIVDDEFYIDYGY